MGDGDWDDVERELNSPSGAGAYFKPKALAVNASVEIVVTGHVKWLDTKYPIKDKAGKDLGYTWRFKLGSGQVWDVSNANRKVLLAGLHPNGQEQVVPGRFRVTNLGMVVNKQPSVRVEFLGSVQSTATT